MKNIILIGMPGSGKTTIGRQLAKLLKLSFFDCDAEISKSQGKSIDQIFSEQGEDFFRRLETETIKNLPADNFVISTGGGIIEKSENVKLLRQNGAVIFIDRPTKNILSDIDTAHRPLLKNDKSRLDALFERRIDIYNNACDIKIKNSGTADDAVQKIIHEVTNNG